MRLDTEAPKASVLQTCEMRITVPGHELEFVDELYRWNEEGQGFTTARLGCSQHIPADQTDL